MVVILSQIHICYTCNQIHTIPNTCWLSQWSHYPKYIIVITIVTSSQIPIDYYSRHVIISNTYYDHSGFIIPNTYHLLHYPHHLKYMLIIIYWLHNPKYILFITSPQIHTPMCLNSWTHKNHNFHLGQWY